LKTQGQLLESAQQALSKRESSSNMMISSVVAHVAALFKNHLPDLNMELLHKDFTVDDAKREALVSSGFHCRSVTILGFFMAISSIVMISLTLSRKALMISMSWMCGMTFQAL
jgi:hypothetical protein